ncbi:alpha/beta fold hydrolase [Planococcus sp. X10-3]|uniref:alpha/beta fold hydrolase n=1 Tax=Planococcus sp. X10-3 TaxID=3061240 RepID=UPI003BB200C1
MWKWQAEGPAKAVIVLIHSAYEHHLRYAWQIKQWRSAGFEVVMGDLPGHGKNGVNPKAHWESFESYEGAISEMLDVAIELEKPVFIVAHGLGATLAINFLSKHSVEVAGAVFTSPWLSLSRTPSKLSSALSGLPKITSQIKIKHEMTIEELTRNPEVIELERDDELYKTDITIGWYRELQAYMKQAVGGKQPYPDIPTFVQTAEKDLITDKEVSKNWLKQQNLKEFSYKEWKDAYHDLFQEPEREDVFITTHLFLKNVLRSLGYVVK